MKEVPPLQPDWAVTPSARGLSLMSQVLTGLVMPDMDQAHDGLQQSLLGLLDQDTNVISQLIKYSPVTSRSARARGSDGSNKVDGRDKQGCKSGETSE